MCVCGGEAERLEKERLGKLIHAHTHMHTVLHFFPSKFGSHHSNGFIFRFFIFYFFHLTNLYEHFPRSVNISIKCV